MSIFDRFNSNWCDSGYKSHANSYRDSIDLNTISHGISLLWQMRSDETIAECVSLLAPEAWFALDTNIALLSKAGLSGNTDQETAVGLSRMGDYLFTSSPITTYRGLYDHFQNYLENSNPYARELSFKEIEQEIILAPKDEFSTAIELIKSDKPQLLNAFIMAKSIIDMGELPQLDVSISASEIIGYVKTAVEKGTLYVAGQKLGAALGTVSPFTSGGMVLAPWVSLSSFSGYMNTQSHLYDLLEITAPLNVHNATIIEGVKTAINEIDIGAMKSAFAVTPFGVIFTLYGVGKKCAEIIKVKSKDHNALAGKLLTIAKDWENKSLDRLVCLMLLANQAKELRELIKALCNKNTQDAQNKIAGWLEP
ncbi:hypothetical protein KIH87_14770 [Paraneptunicella aestuarii]|uniref:hypothetical protein n=1 Tax=Paraneptunicella aestuarii TaxID=2831148 RepID=UPI001E426106|nr:hypothetical protein [Paraneptunicella aestuarii]UAA37944.1 hypothetical protein KIH87_14770 [Paraneptunicella aestuarii]